MDSDDFYVILPSNVKSTKHHPNKTSHYITPLPKPFELDSTKWEVGLVEINYPHSFDNIFPPMTKVVFGFYDHVNQYPVEKVRELEAAYYNSIEDIINSINEMSPPSFRGHFDYAKKGRKHVKLVLFAGESVQIHPLVAQILGFEKHKWRYALHWDMDEVPDRYRYKASFLGDIRALMYNMYIYSNLVRESLVGDSYVPLLRTVSVQGTEGSYIHKLYEKVHYCKLSSDFIQDIEIKIRDETGQQVRFRYGKVVIKLHFRKKRFFP